MMPRARSFALLAALAACAPPATADLGTALKGIDRSRFLSCSGPPVLELNENGSDRMSFVTNLKGGAMIGIQNPGALSPTSCTVDATFVNSRLTQANFSGDQSMCQLVFGPCLSK